MKVILKKKPKNVTIIEGFPGFGLIGTIAIEFLLDHLETEKIGIIEMDDIPPMIAIHDNEVIEPISLHYNKKYNLVFVHAINIGKNLGWKLAHMVQDLATTLSAKEIISLEGVGSPDPTSSRVFYYAQKKTAKVRRLDEMATPLREGVIVGVTGALLAKELNVPLVALFAEARNNMPDSKAAAEIIKALDVYTGLTIDPKPLLKQAADFEKKLRGLVKKGSKAEDIQQTKRLSYVG